MTNFHKHSVSDAFLRAIQLFEVGAREDEIRAFLHLEFGLPAPVREEVIEQAFERAEV